MSKDTTDEKNTEKLISISEDDGDMKNKIDGKINECNEKMGNIYIEMDDRFDDYKGKNFDKKEEEEFQARQKMNYSEFIYENYNNIDVQSPEYIRNMKIWNEEEKKINIKMVENVQFAKRNIRLINHRYHKSFLTQLFYLFIRETIRIFRLPYLFVLQVFISIFVSAWIAFYYYQIK